MGWIGLMCFLCVAIYPIYLMGKFVFGFFTGANFMSHDDRRIHEHNKMLMKQQRVNRFWYNYVWQYIVTGISALVLLAGISMGSIGVGFFGFMFLMAVLFICAVGASYRKNHPKMEGFGNQEKEFD